MRAITSWAARLLLPWPIRAHRVALPDVCDAGHLLQRLGDQLSGLFTHHRCLEDGLRLDENLTYRSRSASPFISAKVFTRTLIDTTPNKDFCYANQKLKMNSYVTKNSWIIRKWRFIQCSTSLVTSTVPRHSDLNFPLKTSNRTWNCAIFKCCDEFSIETMTASE